MSAPEKSAPKRQRQHGDDRDERVAQRMAARARAARSRPWRARCGCSPGAASRSSRRGCSADARPMLARVSVATGSTRWRSRSMRPPSPMVAMPPAGSQPSVTAKTRISIERQPEGRHRDAGEAEQIDGAVERASRAAARRRCRAAAPAPGDSTKLAPISSAVLPSRGSSTVERRLAIEPRIAEIAGERRARPGEIALDQRPVEAVERLEPRHIGRRSDAGSARSSGRSDRPASARSARR